MGGGVTAGREEDVARVQVRVRREAGAAQRGEPLEHLAAEAGRLAVALRAPGAGAAASTPGFHFSCPARRSCVA